MSKKNRTQTSTEQTNTETETDTHGRIATRVRANVHKGRIQYRCFISFFYSFPPTWTVIPPSRTVVLTFILLLSYLSIFEAGFTFRHLLFVLSYFLSTTQSLGFEAVAFSSFLNFLFIPLDPVGSEAVVITFCTLLFTRQLGRLYLHL